MAHGSLLGFYFPRRQVAVVAIVFALFVVQVQCQTYATQIDINTPRTERTEEVIWAFENGMNGWCNATAEEVQSELWSTGGELRATVAGKSPKCDSPPFVISIVDREVDKHHFCIRMKHNSAAKKGLIWVRKWTPSALAHWDQDPDILQGNATAPFTPAHTDFSSTPWNDGDYYAVEFDLIEQPMVYHTYFIPIYGNSTGYLGNITQFRFFPLGDGSAQKGERWTIDWISVTKAPTIKKVEGCTRSPKAPRNLLIQNSPVVAIGLPWNDGVECVMPGDGTNTFSSRDDVGAFATWCNSGVNNKYFNTTMVDEFGVPAFTALTDDATAQIQDEEYAATFNCQQKGGERITITGHNFGDAGAFVYIGGEICADPVHEAPGTQISCTTPAAVGSIDDPSDALKDVVVMNGALQGLSHTVPYYAYAVPADDSVGNITISNVCARSVDLEWEAPQNYWRAVTITGYYITSRASDYNRSYSDGFVVGNITHTTIIGLEQNTNYQFQISALVEDQVFSDIWLQLDHYGRRSFPSRTYVDEFTLVGTPGVSPIVRTLEYDFNFPYFTAASTQNQSAHWPLNTVGHLGNFGGEGHYGLIIVGDAALENCNQSAACCDMGTRYKEPLNPRLGSGPTFNASSCDTICSGMGMAAQLGFSFEYLNGISQPDLVPQSGPGLPAQSIVVAAADEYDFNELTLENIAFQCGTALRLTPSRARMTGGMWYPRKQNVREGFVTEFEFRISNPSTVCRIMDGVYTHCRSRGADGFAFVVHNMGSTELGNSGMGLGYDAINNSLAVEFDTFFNAENGDQYENAVSVHTRGSRYPNSAQEGYSLGASTGGSNLVDRAPIPGNESDTYDYTDGIHKVKIVYTPVFDDDMLMSGRFTASAHVVSFLENADYQYGGQADWGTGMGTLAVYLDDMGTPLFIIPLNLDATLDLDNGRAFVGFTAATGEEMWQQHDIMSWHFTATREDPPYSPPPLINGVGAHACSGWGSGEDQCAHY